MDCPDCFLYEYAVVRYVPDVERGEFVNVGLIMMCKRRRWMRGVVRLNEKRLKALDPDVDLEQLKVRLSLMERTDVPDSSLPVEERYRWLTAVKSAIIQTSPSHPGIVMPDARSEVESPSEILESEFNRLFSILVP